MRALRKKTPKGRAGKRRQPGAAFMPFAGGFLLSVAVIFFSAGYASPIQFGQGAHGNKASMPKACGSCHVGHGKEMTPMLPSSEEELCYECHGDKTKAEKSQKSKRLGSVAGMADISNEFSKPSHHPVEISGAHSPREHSGLRVNNPQRHSECVDCHHHHRTERKGPPVARGSIERRRSSLNRTDYEYNLCYECHGRGSITAPMTESTDPENEFDVSNSSYHPVQGRGRNSNVPSLILPLTEESIINCTECHNSDNPSGPNGPHGSMYAPILVRNFNREDDSVESEFQYSLCYGCHARSSILGDQSFPLHSDHIVEERASCHACHNAHGSPFNKHLIFFDDEIVSPSSSGRLEFVDLGEQSGQCYLTCHGKDHNPLAYP
jgi:predicted CXXCH cytochrome family protein